MADKIKPPAPAAPLPEDYYDFLSRIGLAPVERGMRNITTNVYDLLAEADPALYRDKANQERVLQALKSAENPPSAKIREASAKAEVPTPGYDLVQNVKDAATTGDLAKLKPTQEAFSRALGIYADTPELLLSQAGESVPYMLPALIAGFVTRSPAVAAGVQAPVSGVSKAYENIYGEMMNRGLNPLVADDIEKARADVDFQKWIDEKAIPSAAFVGALDALSMLVAGRSGAGIGGNLREALVEQPALGATGEAGAQLIATGQVKPFEVLGEALGEPVMSIPEITLGALSRADENSEAKDITQETPNAIVEPVKTPEIDVPDFAPTETLDTPTTTTLDDVKAAVLNEPVKAAAEVIPNKAIPPSFNKSAFTKNFVNLPTETSTLDSPYTGVKALYTQLPVSKLGRVMFPDLDTSTKLSVQKQPDALKKKALSYSKLPQFDTPVTITVEPQIDPKTDTVKALKVVEADGQARTLAYNSRNTAQEVPVEVKFATLLTPKQQASLDENPNVPLINTAGKKIPLNVNPIAIDTDQGVRRVPMTQPKTPSVSTAAPSGFPSQSFSPAVQRAFAEPSTVPQSLSNLDLTKAASNIDALAEASPGLQRTLTEPDIQAVARANFVPSLISRVALSKANKTLDTLSSAQVFATYDVLRNANVLSEADIKVLDNEIVANGKAAAKIGNLVETDVQVFNQQAVEEFLFDRYIRGDGRAADLPPGTRKAFEKINGVLTDLAAQLRDRAKVKTYEDMFENQDATIASSDMLDEVFDKYQQAKLQKIADGLGQSFLQNDLAALTDAASTENYRIDPQSDDANSLTYLTKSLSIVGRVWRNWASLAEHAPIMARAYSILRGREQDTAQILKTFNGRLRNIVGRTEADKAKFVEANTHLDRLIQTNQPVRLNNFGQLVYTYKGSRITVPREDTQKVLAVNNYFKGFLELLLPVIQVRAGKLLGIDPQSVTLDRMNQLLPLYRKGGERENQPKAEALLKYTNNLDDIQALKDPAKPYIPRMRFGDIAIAVHRIGPDGKMDKTQQVGTWTIEPGLKGRVTKKEIADTREQILADLKDAGVSLQDVVIGKEFQMTYDSITEQLGADFMTFELLSGLVNSMNPKEYAEIADRETNQGQNLLQSTLEDFREKAYASGLSKHLIPRKNVLGYSKDYLRNAQAYTQAWARNIPNLKWSEVEANLGAFVKANTFRDKKGEIQTWVQPLISAQLQYMASPFGDATFMRTLNHAWTMGFNPSSAVFQLPTAFVNLPAWLSIVDSNLIGMEVEATNNLRRVAASTPLTPSKIDDTLFDRWFSDGLIKSKEQLDVMKDLWRRGSLQASIGQEFIQDLQMMETSAGKAKQFLAKVGQLSGYMMQTTEAWTRLVSALMISQRAVDPKYQKRFLKAYKDNPLFDEMIRTKSQGDLAFVLTELGIDEVHGVYTKAARGLLNRGTAMQIVAPMVTYTQTVFQLIANLSAARGPEGVRALAVLSALFFLTGGLNGMPGWDVLEAIYAGRSLRKTDLEKDIREGLVDEGWPPWLVDRIYNGIGGASVGSRLGLQTPGLDLALAFLDPETKATDPLGILGSLISGVQTAQQKASMGAGPLEIASEITPAAPRNLFKSITAMENGYSTKNGNRLVNPDDLTATDNIGQLLGFSPDKVINARKYRYWANLNDIEGTPAKTRAVEITAKLKEDLRETEDETQRQELLTKIKDARKDLLEFNRRNKIRMSKQYWDSFDKSVTDRLKQRKNPTRPLTKSQRGPENKLSKEALGIE